MKLAVIVVNFNDEKDTLNYVKRITKYEIINRIVVVDNNSTNENSFQTLKTLEEGNDKVNVIQSKKNGGYSYGNNFAIKYLENKGENYDYYAISNPDIEITEDAIKRCVSFLDKHKDTAISAPRMYNKDNKPIRRSAWKTRSFGREIVHSLRILELLFYKVLRNGEYSEEDYKKIELPVEVISGAFFVIRKTAYDEINGFDENVFLFYEEDILADALRKANYKIYSLNDVSFKHYESQTIGKTFSYYKKIKELYSSKMYYHKEYTKINKFQVLIFQILNGIRVIELLIEIPIRKILGK